MIGRRTLKLGTAAAASLLASIAQSQTTAQPQGSNSWTYGADFGVGRSDNINLVPTGKISENMATADLDFDLTQQSSRLQDSLKGNFSYFDFLEHTYGNELVGRFDGTATFALVPERIFWTAQDDFGQGQVSAFGAPTPNNIQNINYLSTGPDFKFRLGGTSFLDLTGRYARAQYGNSPFDSNRLLGGAELGLQLSARSTVGLNGNFERVLFTNTAVNTDYDRSTAFLSYEFSGARTTLSGKLGLARVDERGYDDSGPLILLGLTRKVSPASSVELSAGRDLTDATASFADLQAGATNAISAAPSAVTSSIYTITYAQLSWEYARDRTKFRLSARWDKDDYGSQPLPEVDVSGQGLITSTGDPSALDYSRRGGEFDAERSISRVLTAQLQGSLYSTNYAHSEFVSDTAATNYLDVRLSASVDFHEGRALDFRLRVDHIERIVSGVGSGSGYKENVVFVTVGYRPRIANAPASE